MRNSAYLKIWTEYVSGRLGQVDIILKFSDTLEPTDQIYSSIANEIYNSNIEANIVKQTEENVIIRLRDSDIILKKYKENTR